MTNPLYASYIIHLIARAPDIPNQIERLVRYDEILESLAAFPQLYSCVLADAVLPLESYLSLRPEYFDQVAQYAQAGRLECGPWYVFRHDGMDSLEITIRNLKLGMETIRLLQMPIAAAPLPEKPMPQLPQILWGFGIRAGFMQQTPGGKSAEYITGLDGISLGVFQLHDAAAWEQQRDQFAATTPGRHLLAQSTGKPQDWLNTYESLRKRLTADDVFLSSRAGLAKSALQFMGDPPQSSITQHADTPGVSGIGNHPLVRRLLREVEPLTVWAADNALKRPQRILQGFWRDVLRDGEKADLHQRIQTLLDYYNIDTANLIEKMILVDQQAFEITAIKLRDDGQPGVVIRGYNPTGREHPVTLRPWKAFASCEVLKMDESRTGATLPMIDGAIHFTSNPHRILTFWLR